jgi:uncharacterized protein YidB (DUF937 family)
MGESIMSILSNLMSGLENLPNANAPAGVAPASASSGAAVLTQVIAMLQSRPGGISGLIQSFEQGGLGHVIQSWLGTGQNLPISPDQLRGVLGSDWVAHITQATGLSQAQVEQHVSALLPHIVDHLSPNGQLPQGDLSSALAGVAQKFLHG